MLNFILEVIKWVLCLYGLFSVIQDYMNYKIYEKIKEKIKFVMTVKDVEDGIETYIRELTFGKNFFNRLVVIDLDSNDDTNKILHRLEKEKYNMKVLNKEEGKKYLSNMIK